MKQIFIASDHAGFELKQRLINLPDYPWVDLGPPTADRVDYPDYTDKLARELLNNPDSVGVLICGSGIGMSIRANRYSGIRAALVDDLDRARLCREHNNANVLCLASRFLDFETAEQMLKIFLETPFEGGRHKIRVEKLDKEI